SEYGKVAGKLLNIRDVESVESLAGEIKEEFGNLDILINNAGGQFPSPAEAITPNGWRAVIDTNLNGTWNVTQTMAKHFFFAQQEGAIVNIIANIERGFPGMSHTGAARAGVENLTKSLSVEWVHHGIRINSIAPGIIESSGLEQYPPQFRAAMEPSIPMRRLGKVEDIAYLTLFLTSPMANYITGESIYVDGGQRLWGSMWSIPKQKIEDKA
ncbi:MAG: SDR family oxidoreductase, partial [Flavobacteriales bacterium]|nr:SDR family oxidoreductase [Flavobacteriales bacterium]